MFGEWKPKWTDAQIILIPQKVEEGLKKGTYSSLINKAQSQCKGKTWWNQQFDVTARAACSSLNEIESRIARYKEDSTRVIRLIRDQWDVYIGNVISCHGNRVAEQIISVAKSSPSDLYLYLVTVHIQRPWLNINPGLESSLLSAWSKIGRDNQFLWPMKTFEKLFIEL